MKKRVLLLGDSIRMGYDSFVKEELSECDVFYDDEDNGRFTAYTIGNSTTKEGKTAHSTSSISTTVTGT